MHNIKQNLKKYDKHLKKFNATKALDAALEVGLVVRDEYILIAFKT